MTKSSTSLFSSDGAAPFDEAYVSAHELRSIYKQAAQHFDAIGAEGVEALQHSADLSMLNQGVTFTVYE